jgi:hypothetical protein
LDGYTGQAFYEVRRLANNPGGELLFGAQACSGIYSESVFALSLDGKYKVRSSSIEESERAEKLSNTKYDVFANMTRVIGDEVEYLGKSFKKTGQSWEGTAALPSPSGKLIAVFSHTSGKDQPSYGFWGGGGRGPGEPFVDIYEASTGEKLLSGHHSHKGGGEPAYLFNHAFWVGSEYFVIPLLMFPEECLIGILPDR